jgi:hypothetical protein
MRSAKFFVAVLFVLATVTAGAAPRDDDPRHSPIQRVIAFLKHVVALDDGGLIGPPHP